MPEKGNGVGSLKMACLAISSPRPIYLLSNKIQGQSGLMVKAWIGHSSMALKSQIQPCALLANLDRTMSQSEMDAGVNILKVLTTVVIHTSKKKFLIVIQKSCRNYLKMRAIVKLNWEINATTVLIYAEIILASSMTTTAGPRGIRSHSSSSSNCTRCIPQEGCPQNHLWLTAEKCLMPLCRVLLKMVTTSKVLWTWAKIQINR